MQHVLTPTPPTRRAALEAERTLATAARTRAEALQTDVSAASPAKPSAGEPRARGGHIGAIDGLRALAVLGVLAFHLDALPGGFLGVDLFFVISGFVITRYILLEREATGRFRIGTFWVRRAKRLAPAVLAVLIGVQIWLHLFNPAGQAAAVNGQTLASLVSGTNWFNIFAELGYWDSSTQTAPLNHMWSLAIEEQFYMVWPLILLFVRRRWLIAAVAGAGIAASVLVRFSIGSSWSFDRLYEGTDVRVVALLCGVLLATFLSGRPGVTVERFAARPVVRVLTGVVAAMAVAVSAFLWITMQPDVKIFDGPLLLATALETLLVAIIVTSPRNWFARILSLAPLRFVGRVSFSLYLWHWPVIAIVNEVNTGMTGVSLGFTRALLIVILTLLSYGLIENPIRRSATRARKIVTGLVVCSLAIAAVVAVPSSTTAALLPKPAPVAGGSSGTSTGPGAEYAAKPITPGMNVMIVGDSWADNLGKGMAEPALKTSVQNLGIGGCGIMDPDFYRDDQGNEYYPPIQCTTWPTDWPAAIAKNRPDAAIIDLGNWDQKQAKIDGAWVSPGDAVFDTRYSERLDQAISIFQSAGIPTFMTTTVTLNDARERSVAMNKLLLDAAARHPGVTTIDLGHYLCHDDEQSNCPAVRDGQPIYDATGHLAPYWQLQAATWTLGEISAKLTPMTSTPATPPSR